VIDLHFWRTPWIRPHKWKGQTLDEFPSLRRWYDVAARPAVQRDLAVLRDRLQRNRAKPAEHVWEILFNQPAANR
jgi:GSH-dependent disulfide-bond oxidoreductase